MSNHIRSNKVNISQWRNHTEYELLTLNDMKQSKSLIDKIKQFSILPPEFWCIIDMVVNCYLWFYIDMNHKINSENMETYINDDLSDTLWIDGLQRQVKVRKQALPELMLWCDKIEVELKNEDASTNESDGR